MPRLKEHKDADEMRRVETKRIIRRGMAERDMEHLEDLALAMGKSRPVISKRMKNNSWSLEEAVKLVKVLRLSAEDASVMLGATGGARG